MFDASFSHAAGFGFRNVIESVSELFHDTALLANPNGFTIQGMDDAHVALVAFRVSAEKLTDYQCEHTLEIGVNMATLASVLRHVDKDTQLVQLRYEAAVNRAVLLVNILHSASRSSEYSLTLTNTSPESVHIPSQDYKAAVRLPSLYFSKACKDCNQFGSNDSTICIDVTGAPEPYVEFSGRGDVGNGSLRFGASAGAAVCLRTLNVKSEGGDVGVKTEPGVMGGGIVDVEDEGEEEPAAIDLPVGEVALAVREPIALHFALRFMTMFAKSHKCAKDVVMRLAKNAPCAVEYDVPDVGTVVFYLAPKAEE